MFRYMLCQFLFHLGVVYRTAEAGVKNFYPQRFFFCVRKFLSFCFYRLIDYEKFALIQIKINRYIVKPSHLGNFWLLFKVRFKGVQLPFINHLPKMFIEILHRRIPNIQKKTRLLRLHPGTKTLCYHLNFFLRMEFEAKRQW